MTQELLIGTPTTVEHKASVQEKVTQPLHAELLLISVVGVICSTLEIELLEQVDTLSLYMTFGEILLDACVALLILSALAVVWWLGILLFAKTAVVVFGAKRYRQALLWRLGLAIPFSYFAVNLLDAVLLESFPRWYPVGSGVAVSAFVCLLICIVGVSFIKVSSLQKFCRTRLALLGWLHVAGCIVALCALLSHHVSSFQDYVHPGRGVTASALPDIYLITFDALRTNDTSVYGYTRPTTPNLERFAQRSFIFDYFFANSNLTTPTTTSIETGELPWSHRIYQLGGFLRGQAQGKNLAALLRQGGYYTAMVFSNYWASPVQHRTLNSYDAVQHADAKNLSGEWMRSIDLIGLNTLPTLSGPLLKRWTTLRHALDFVVWGNHYPFPPEEVFDRARTVLERPDIRQPRFLWVHMMPPHDPFLPPLPYRTRFLPTKKLTRVYDFLGYRNTSLPRGVSATEMRARYDEMIAYGDHALGEFFDWLDETGRLDRAIVIVSSDHGECFEHNWYGHTGPKLYNGMIHIPLLIHLPGQRQGSHISELAQQADLLPTILDLVGEPVPGWTDGRSLKPLLDGRALPERLAFSMNLERDSSFKPIAKGTLAIMDNEFKYVNYLAANEEELYRYRVDEYENDNLIASMPDVAKQMRSVLLQKLKQVNQKYAP